MTGAVVAIGHRYLPHGWRDFGRQLAIWFGFLLAYQVVRGIADRSPARAFENGLWVIEIEQRATGLVELSFQQMIESSELLTAAASWTYWNSEFTVVALTLLWVYLRRNEHFYRFRNWILLANAIGLVGYLVAPTAPPRMFRVFGFEDTLLQFGSLNHGSGLVELASNPYAAMPSIHAADALIVGVTMALIVRRWWAKALWIAWPAWVWFSVMATANHFWLDIAAGVLVALLAGAIVYRRQLRRALGRTQASPA
ncbi:MAG TPA: phosphatase PAP2 family protein [Gaiellaceae bacterium]|nr:phosphatase PAP2 family protein [Gaiellaceae bacterium]